MTRLSITSKMAKAADPQIISFDSEFWGRPIGRAYTPDVNRWAADNLVGTVCLLVSADDPAGIQDAEERGFRFMDVRVTFERSSLRSTPWLPVRPYLATDLEPLIRIARESHRITRFYADPHFDDSRCDDLYEAWIRNSVDGWAQDTLVAPSARTDVAGYVTVHVADGVGSIGLIAVDEQYRGYGLGKDLVNAAVGAAHQRGATRMTVVTQGRNIHAQRLFQRCGFVTESTELWLHKSDFNA